MNEATFACRLTSPELQKRKATIIQELKSMVTERAELTWGYSYRLNSTNEILDLVFEFVKSERECCPFFNFQVTVNASSITLEITGEPGAKEYMGTELDL